MSVRVAINGFGRIGRCVARVWAGSQNDSQAQIVAVNDLTDSATLAHLFKYDSLHGRLGAALKNTDGVLEVGGDPIKCFAERDPAKLPWKDMEVDVVLECTGFFRTRDAAAKHLAAGAKKVILSAPAKGEVDGTFCFGINSDSYDPSKHHVISNASCTTNCLAPVAQILHQQWGIDSGMMTTVHSYTGDQRLLDAPHSDMRRARAGAMSMVPTTTGAAKAIGLVMPELAGKLDGLAVRVPTPNVSLVDLTAHLAKNATKESINQAFREAANGRLAGVLQAVDEPLVSVDFMSSTHSSCVDLATTMVQKERYAKVLAWYDNEMGYSARLWDMCQLVGGKL